MRKERYWGDCPKRIIALQMFHEERKDQLQGFVSLYHWITVVQCALSKNVTQKEIGSQGNFVEDYNNFSTLWFNVNNKI